MLPAQSSRHKEGSRRGLATNSAQRPYRVDLQDFPTGSPPPDKGRLVRLRDVLCDPSKRLLIPLG